MSYLPAEELDDYDSDDGFTGEEDFIQKYINAQSFETTSKPKQNSCMTENINSSNSTVADQKEREGSANKPSVPSSGFPLKPFGLNSVPRKTGFDVHGSSSHHVYTEEDFKMAALKGNYELAQTCLKQGIPVDQPLYSGWTALMYASNNAKPVVVEFLLKEGADANYHMDMFTPLMCACSSSVPSEEDVSTCSRQLMEAGADINAKDRYHSTPLMLASRAGKLETVKLLLDKGARVNEQDSRGWTALTSATQKSHKAVVMALLEAGADATIRHRDRLTVKDLAAHLPTDEMLALLEGRPFIAPDYGEDVSHTPQTDVSSHCLLDSKDLSMKFTDLRYGELELFLYGLELAHVLPLCQKQLIDLPLLLTLTEQDLTNAGIDQVGARKKILDAAQAVHKRSWEASSLVSVHFNKCIRCADAVAMVANLSKHVRYITSTVNYIKEQLRRHPDAVMQATDRVSSPLLLRHVEDSLKNVTSLTDQLIGLRLQLNKEMGRHLTEPADVIKFEEKPKGKISGIMSFSILCIALGTFTFMFWKRDQLIKLIK